MCARVNVFWKFIVHKTKMLANKTKTAFSRLLSCSYCLILIHRFWFNQCTKSEMTEKGALGVLIRPRPLRAETFTTVKQHCIKTSGRVPASLISVKLKESFSAPSLSAQTTAGGGLAESLQCTRAARALGGATS